MRADPGTVRARLTLEPGRGELVPSVVGLWLGWLLVVRVIRCQLE